MDKKQINTRCSLIDLLRVLAIFLVVFFHISLEIFPDLTKDFINIAKVYRFNVGSLGVAIFIILSGLSLALKYKNRKIKYNNFIAKRFLRIYPVYFICLFLGIIIYYTITNNILENGYYYMANAGFSDIVCSITGFCHYLQRIGGPFVGTSWFLGIIIPLYLLFPFLIKKFKSSPLTVLFITFLISLLYRYIEIFIPSLYYKVAALFAFRHLFEFSLGIYLALVIKDSFWAILNKFKEFSRFISWLGLLSFPLFLIHHPLLFILNYLNMKNVSNFISVPIYLAVSLIISQIILLFWQKINPKKQEI